MKISFAEILLAFSVVLNHAKLITQKSRPYY